MESRLWQKLIYDYFDVLQTEIAALEMLALQTNTTWWLFLTKDGTLIKTQHFSSEVTQRVYGDHSWLKIYAAVFNPTETLNELLQTLEENRRVEEAVTKEMKVDDN